MTAGIRSKSESMTGEEVRICWSNHIGNFQACSIKRPGIGLLSFVKNLVVSVSNQAAIGAEEIGFKLQRMESFLPVSGLR